MKVKPGQLRIWHEEEGERIRREGQVFLIVDRQKNPMSPNWYVYTKVGIRLLYEGYISECSESLT
jgi:hypothetical protein